MIHDDDDDNETVAIIHDDDDDNEDNILFIPLLYTRHVLYVQLSLG